jgi:hypothetical protein
MQLIEISHFFTDICLSKLHTQHMEQFETNTIEIICKLEMVFHPFLFDLMAHIPIHLVYKVKAKGLV